MNDDFDDNIGTIFHLNIIHDNSSQKNGEPNKNIYCKSLTWPYKTNFQIIFHNYQ